MVVFERTSSVAGVPSVQGFVVWKVMLLLFSERQGTKRLASKRCIVPHVRELHARPRLCSGDAFRLVSNRDRH